MTMMNIFTVNTEAPFFPSPQLVLDLNEVIQEETVDGNNIGEIIPILAKQIDNLYPPISMFELYQPFTDEDFYD